MALSSGRPARAPCVCESQRRCGERASRDGGAGLCVWICSPSSSALRSPGTVFSVSVAVLGISDRLFLSFSGLLPLLFELISASERGSWVSAVLRLPARAPFGPLGSALRVPGPLPRAADVRLPADFWRRESGQLCRDLAFRTLFAAGRSEVPCLRALPHPSRPLPPPSPASLRRRLGVLPSASSRTLHFLRPLFPLWLAWACLPPGRAPSDSGGFVGRPFPSRLRLPGLIEKGPRWHGTAAFHFMLPCSFPPFTLSTPSPRPLLMSGRDFCSLFPWAEVGTRRAARPRETVRTLGGQQLLLL